MSETLTDSERPEEVSPAILERAQKLFFEHWNRILIRTDRLFAGLLFTQWVAGIAVAVIVSPFTWAGSTSSVHTHVLAAIFLGGAVAALPIALVFLRPGWSWTRYTIAGSQVAFSGLLIHLTGGRIETHFHIFGSLAFLFFYRDWKVFVPATVITAADHLVRGLVYPMSVYGVLEASPWRTVEHAWWVLFEDAFLIYACVQAQQEMRDWALNKAQLEHTNARAERAEQCMLELVTHASNGDLTHELSNEDSRVTGQLGSGLQKMVVSLGSLVSQVQQLGITVASSTTQLAAGVREQEATITEQAATTRELLGSARRIADTAGELVSTMVEVSTAADETTELATSGQQSLARMESNMSQVAHSSSEIVSKLADLSEKASNISSVVTTINKVADQTNLLSLNASIEAEKAGEFGRGFGVVATEIRRLADQTAVATLDIEDMIKEMQSAVSAGVMGMEQFAEKVRLGAEEVRGVAEQLRGIIERIKAMMPSFENVSEGMGEQSQLALSISESLTQLNEVAQGSVESIQQSSASLQELKDTVLNMQDEVSQFKVKKTYAGTTVSAGT